MTATHILKSNNDCILNNIHIYRERETKKREKRKYPQGPQLIIGPNKDVGASYNCCFVFKCYTF